MNKVVEEAKRIKEWDNCFIPDLEVGEECTLNDVWDGEGENPLKRRYCSYKITDTTEISYDFEVLAINEEDILETEIKITDISFV